ncbi:MAG: orotidine-5'-phosphate decarboxylase [SAR202 cluster bacterium]|nr:orotidine-5'-phosphate decarboxylase [SAR202 cluster bacterium]
MKGFTQRLNEAMDAAKSLVCIGLDPDPALMPVADVLAFNKGIVDATKNLVCAYKPNLAFYEALGIPGLKALEGTVAHIRAVAPRVLIIGDGKRGDVGHASSRYAQAMFDVWGFDAATVNASGGGESLAPFFERPDKGAFVWCRSSNPGAAEFQGVAQTVGGRLYERIAESARSWDKHGNIGLVVGATYPAELTAVRRLCPDMPILLPGVGAQGGDLEASVKAGVDWKGRGLLVSSSRGIIYASRSTTGYATAARSAAKDLRDSINGILDAEGKEW